MNNASRGRSKGESRSRLNFWIDLVTGFVFSMMLGTGILLKWILPPGSRGGSGFVWLGEGRHVWGDLHFYTAIAMLILVVIHVWLHFDWVIHVWKRLLGSLKSPLTWIIILLFLANIFMPLIIDREYSASYEAEHDKAETESNKNRLETANP